MKYQTFTTKKEMSPDEYSENFANNFPEILKKYYNPNKETYNKLPESLMWSLEVPNTGGIIVGGYYGDSQNYQNIKCNHFIEYLGFRDTKKFNNMLKDISKSLEDICYVYTGEIK